MIVRISGEGQWTLADSVRERVNELDNAAVAAVGPGAGAALPAPCGGLRTRGRPAGGRPPADDLHPSDVILPPADLSFAEAGEEFTGEGLIPD